MTGHVHCACVDRLREALVTASPFIWRPMGSPDGYWRNVEEDRSLDRYLYEGHTYREVRDAARIVDAALAATPVAPAPAATERCAGCGHETRFHADGQCDCEGDGEAGLCPCPEPRP